MSCDYLLLGWIIFQCSMSLSVCPVFNWLPLAKMFSVKTGLSFFICHVFNYHFLEGPLLFFVFWFLFFSRLLNVLCFTFYVLHFMFYILWFALPLPFSAKTALCPCWFSAKTGLCLKKFSGCTHHLLWGLQVEHHHTPFCSLWSQPWKLAPLLTDPHYFSPFLH